MSKQEPRRNITLFIVRPRQIWLDPSDFCGIGVHQRTLRPVKVHDGLQQRGEAPGVAGEAAAGARRATAHIRSFCQAPRLPHA